MTVLQSFPPEICSLICQDSILERLDLNAICFISHAFRNEAQRELSRCFPCLRDDSHVKAWCLSLKRRPRLAKKIRGLALLLPRPSAFRAAEVERLTRSLHMCVNLKELSVLFQVSHRRRPGLHEYMYSSSTHMLSSVAHRFKLTKFVNGYFAQDCFCFTSFLNSQPNLESLELHSSSSGNLSFRVSPLHCLKSLGCSPQFLDKRYCMTKLRLDFGSSEYECEIEVLGEVLSKKLNKNMKSLALFLKQRQSHFPEIIRVIAARNIFIQHLEIHQFFPTQVENDLPLPVDSYGRDIKTLIFRPPPSPAEEADDNPNLCAYVELRTPIGRRNVAEKLMMRTLPTLTRLVLVVHGNDYEFKRNLFTGIITGEELIDRNTREWALVK